MVITPETLAEWRRVCGLIDASCGKECKTALRSACTALQSAIAALEEQGREIERLREALTPSGETKAAYIGEFTARNENGEYIVPWTTIKEIMAAITKRAAEALK